MEYIDQPPPALNHPMQLGRAPNKRPGNDGPRNLGVQSPLTVVVGLPELESPLSPLSTPSPSIRIDDAMSDLSAMSPHTPLLSLSPTTEAAQRALVRDGDPNSGLSPSASALSLGSPGGYVPRVDYQSKGKRPQFKLLDLSPSSGPPLPSPVGVFRQQEVFGLPSPMARDLRCRVEADESIESITTTSDVQVSEDSEFGVAEHDTSRSDSCLGLDLGLSVSCDKDSMSDDDSYLAYGYKGCKEKMVTGIDSDPGVEGFRAQIMQATVVRSAGAELVSSPERSSNSLLNSTRGCREIPKPNEKKTPKTPLPLPGSHLKSPFTACLPAKQGSSAYTLAPVPHPTTLSGSDGASPEDSAHKSSLRTSLPHGRFFGSGQPSPSPKRKPVSRDASVDPHAIDLLHARMQGCARFPERFPEGYLLEAKFAQKYDLETELGCGGYGFVLSARNRMTAEAVAVKFIFQAQIPPHALVMDHNKQIVPLEAVVLRLVRHSGVVEFRDIYKDDIYFYLVQELHGSPWSKNSKNQHKFGQDQALLAMTMQAQSRSKQSPPATPYRPPQGSPLRKLAPSLSMSSVPTLGSPISRELGPRQSLPLSRPPMPRRASYDLFECIEQHERLSEGQAKYIFAQVVDTVGYLDSIGITHRDIKDENLVKVIDFGSAVIRDVRQPPPTYTRFFGTVTFASPEILNEQPYTAPPAEVWTLGILLSFLVMGQSPFPTPEHAKLGIMCEPTGSIVVSPPCMDLIRKCLEPNPALRLSVHQVREHPWLRGALDRA